MATSEIVYGPVSWQRMSDAIDKVKDRLRRAVGVLDAAGIRYAVIGGNAVAAWVSRVDESVVRNAPDVDLLLERSEFERAVAAMEAAGFIHKSAPILGGTGRIEMFLDGPRAKARDVVRVIFAGERVRDDSLLPSPDVDEIDPTTDAFRLIALEPLVRMKLTSFRGKDCVHIRDMMETGQIDATWLERVPPGPRSEHRLPSLCGPRASSPQIPPRQAGCLRTAQPGWRCSVASTRTSRSNRRAAISRTGNRKELHPRLAELLADPHG